MKKLKIANSEEFLLKFLNDNELEIFTFQALIHETNLRLEYLQSTLEQLTKRGLLSRIERGKYCKHTFRNEYVISNYLVEDGVVAYWTALNLHGLTEQIPNTIFVQTTKLKVDKKVFGVDYEFVKVKPQKMVGMEQQGYGNYRYRITNVEKTIVDCFDLPKNAGGFTELIRAFTSATLNADRLIAYSEAIGNLSVIKRIAFLGTFLKKEGFERYTEYAKSKLNEKYSLFDPQGTDEGIFIRAWRLRLNMEESVLKELLTKT